MQLREQGREPKNTFHWSENLVWLKMIVFVYLFLISNGGIDHLYITRLRNELVNGGNSGSIYIQLLI